MFPVGDASALAVHINTLLNDPVQYNRIARQCVERSELYGIDMLAGDVARLYETLVATGHPGTPSRLEEAPEEAEGGESPAEA